jgi:hypothetical protein
METDFDNQCTILGALYSNYGQDPEFEDFVTYNDVGLPLAYLRSEGLSIPTDDGVRYIQETWELFLGGLGIEDTGFENIDEVFEASSEGN